MVGGSWGSTLALAYARRHLERVKAMVLYSIFIPSKVGSVRWISMCLEAISHLFLMNHVVFSFKCHMFLMVYMVFSLRNRC